MRCSSQVCRRSAARPPLSVESRQTTRITCSHVYRPLSANSRPAGTYLVAAIRKAVCAQRCVLGNEAFLLKPELPRKNPRLGRRTLFRPGRRLALFSLPQHVAALADAFASNQSLTRDKENGSSLLRDRIHRQRPCIATFGPNRHPILTDIRRARLQAQPNHALLAA